MPDVRDLYQAFILEHAKNPRNTEFPDPATGRARGLNPLCGDRLELAVRCPDGRLEAIGGRASGCAISKAALSAMTEAVTGKTTDEIRALHRLYQDLVHGRDTDEAKLGPLTPFAAVSAFPLRIRCATLAWQTLLDALAEGGDGK